MPVALPHQQGAELIWLLSLEIGGTTFYLSTQVVNLARDDGTVISYQAGLTEPDYSESLARFSHTVDDMSTALEVVIPGINLAQHRRKGFHLQRATGELSCITAIGGTLQQTHEGRFVHVVGRVSEPTYGYPDAPVGYMTFTLDGRPGADSEPFHSATMSIAGERISTVVTDDDHEGKPYPLVIGQPGAFVNAAGTSRTTSGSPGYIIDKDTASPPMVDTLICAGHHIEATTVTVFAGSPATSYVFNVTNTFDGIGQPIATLDLRTDSSSTSMGSGARSEWRSGNEEFWCCWNTGKTASNPLTGGSINGAGDLLIWALDQTPYEVDQGAWQAARDWLNHYQFSGYINDPGTTVWDWITTIAETIPPLTIRAGTQGIYPIIHDIHMLNAEAETVFVGPDFYRGGPIQVQGTPDEIRNTITLEWALRARTGDYKQTSTVGTFDDDTSTTFATIYSTSSISRFGIRAEAITSSWIYDRATAHRVLSDLVRLKGGLAESVQYQAGVLHSHLMLGDVIKVTDEAVGFSDQLLTVMGKSWTGTGWTLDLLIEDDLARDTRPI